MAEGASFLGRGWSFPPAFSPANGAMHMVSGEHDVRESLRILMLTTPGERVMQPDYGCGLKRLVFAHMDESAMAEIRNIIEQAVLFHEVRVTLEGVEIDARDLYGEGVLRVELSYTLRSTNTRYNIVFPFYYLQGTGLREHA